MLFLRMRSIHSGFLWLSISTLTNSKQPDIKLIDYWLILCHLVPFAQVVLFTIREHTREENKQGIGQCSEKDDLPWPTLKDNQELKEEGGDSPKKTWFVNQIKKSKASSLAVLMMIGKILN